MDDTFVMPWKRYKLRQNTVFAKIDAQGNLLQTSDGFVDITYTQKSDARHYRAAASNLTPLESSAAVTAHQLPVDQKHSDEETHTIIIYTDGSCKNNPGPMGIGVVIIDGAHRYEHSLPIGIGTNNIAELTAIKHALLSLDSKDRTKPIKLHTDSSYSIGVLTKHWKAKANQTLIAQIKTLMNEFTTLTLVKVAAHVGIADNEAADKLAVQGMMKNNI